MSGTLYMWHQLPMRQGSDRPFVPGTWSIGLRHTAALADVSIHLHLEPTLPLRP